MVEIACWEEVSEAALDVAISYMPKFVSNPFIEATMWCLGKSVDSPVRRENIDSNPPPAVGAWSDGLMRRCDFEVLWKISGCQT
jgi:hypothetical protein